MSIANDLCNDHDEILSEFTFVWKITNFSFCTVSKGKALVSPKFKFQSIGISQANCVWQLIFYPRGYNASSVVCHLKAFSSYISKIECHLCVCNVKQQLLYKEGREIDFNYRSNAEEIRELANFGREIFEKLSNDVIVLHCHIGKFTSNKYENLVHCFAETPLSIQRKIFNWKFENFCSLQLKEEKIYGWLAYPIHDKFNTFLNTTLKLFLSGVELKDSTVNIWLTFDGLTAQTFCLCALFIMDENGKVVKNIEKECWLGPIENIVKFSLNREEIISSGLPTDSLVIRGEVNLSGNNGSLGHAVYGMKMDDAIACVMGPTSPEVPINSVPLENPPSPLSSDMLSLFKGDGPPSDFELRVAGRSFPVHQTVLGARSTVFRAMFASDMLETSKRSLELTDVDVDTAERMLLYVYADQEPSPELDWDSLSNLYRGADKYALLGLRKICGDRLSRGLDVDNAPRLLLIADRHSDTLLKKKVVDYIIGQGPIVFESENWKKLVQEDPKLVVDVMHQLIKEKWV